ncbi:MAG: TrkH family potassium uptake protein [Pseudomonadota bacterium]
MAAEKSPALGGLSRPEAAARYALLAPAVHMCGQLLLILGTAMLVAAAVDFQVEPHIAEAFFLSAAITIATGGVLYLSTRQRRTQALDIRQGFLLTTLSWLGIALFAALPFLLSNPHLSYADAFFETMSGLTTTGATVLAGLDEMSRMINLWRALLQWLGGIGIVVMSMTILPALRVGGMQLLQTESSDRSDKILPHLTQVLRAVLALYCGFTVIFAIAYNMAGMSQFDAIVHAMTTIATGGYSTHDASFGYFADRPILEWLATLFMGLSAVTFGLFIIALRGRPQALWRDPQVRGFAALLAVAIAIASYAAWHSGGHDPFTALRRAAFHVVSIVTTTGFTSEDYGHWGALAVGLFFLLYFTGGCTGSTAGSIKVFRLIIMGRILSVIFKRMLSPHRVVRVAYGERPVSEETQLSVASFVFLFLATVLVLALVLASTGLDLLSALSSAATAVANVGPGLGHIVGPVGNFSSLSDTAKTAMALGMLLGRLELLTIFVLFTPSFWRH